MLLERTQKATFLLYGSAQIFTLRACWVVLRIGFFTKNRLFRLFFIGKSRQPAQTPASLGLEPAVTHIYR